MIAAVRQRGHRSTDQLHRLHAACFCCAVNARLAVFVDIGEDSSAAQADEKLDFKKQVNTLETEVEKLRSFVWKLERFSQR